MRMLIATALFLPLAVLANPIHVVKVHLTNNTDSQMHYETLTIGHDTRVVNYPRENIDAHRLPELAIVLNAPSDRWAFSEMTYKIDLPAEMCENKADTCAETVLLNWQTNMGFEGGEGSICGVSGENYESLEHIRSYCDIPTIDPRDPSVLHIHYYFDYAG